MPNRRTLTFAAAALFAAVLLTALAVQRGSALASNLAQATQTGVATDGTGTPADSTGTPTPANTQVGTPAGTGTPAATGTPTPAATRPSPTPITGTQAPLPPGLPARTITVSGVGTASGAPDEAVVSVGVQTDGDTAAEALEQNNQQMQALMDALVDAGVAAADIQTQAVTLFPRYAAGDNGEAATITGYTATNSVAARVRDLDTLGALLDAAVTAGANTIGGIQFAVSDAAELSGQARTAAMADARAKAQQLATLAGATLGPVLSITEGASSGGPIPVDVVRQEGGDVPIAPGSQTVEVSLTVTWVMQ